MHNKNIETFVIEMYKFKNDLVPEIASSIFYLSKQAVSIWFTTTK